MSQRMLRRNKDVDTKLGIMFNLANDNPIPSHVCFRSLGFGF